MGGHLGDSARSSEPPTCTTGHEHPQEEVVWLGVAGPLDLEGSLGGGGSWTLWFRAIPALFLLSWMVLGKSLSLAGPQFPYL